MSHHDDDNGSHHQNGDDHHIWGTFSSCSQMTLRNFSPPPPELMEGFDPLAGLQKMSPDGWKRGRHPPNTADLSSIFGPIQLPRLPTEDGPNTPSNSSVSRSLISPPMRFDLEAIGAIIPGDDIDDPFADGENNNPVAYLPLVSSSSSSATTSTTAATSTTATTSSSDSDHEDKVEVNFNMDSAASSIASPRLSRRRLAFSSKRQI